MYDVIVVGGGPTGSHAAARLAGAGHNVLVLEKNARPGEKSACTGIVGQECVDKFNIDDNVILQRLNSASLFSPSGKQLHLRREETQACVLDRAAFDVSMAGRAQKAGAEYRFGHRVTDVRIEPQAVIVTVASAGRENSLRARAVVIAAGFSPGLVSRLGLGGYRDLAIGVQAEVSAPDIKEVEAYFGEVAPGFFAWLVPSAPGVVKAGLIGRQRPGFYLRAWLSQLASEGKIATSEAKIRFGGIPLKPLPRTYSERMLVVGDAAGQVKPTTGGGIYYGLIGADIAADTLHKALQEDDLSANSLARYERGWRRKLGGELRTGYWARRLFERLSPRQVDRLFDVIKAGGIDEALLKAPDLSFDWHGRAIASLLKYRGVAVALDVVRLPFGLTGKPRRV
jgi:digeranylgeranylglycerophospholipid reductase